MPGVRLGPGVPLREHITTMVKSAGAFAHFGAAIWMLVHSRRAAID